MSDLSALAARLSEAAPPFGGITYQGSEPFGAALTVEKFQLKNGLAILMVKDASAPVIAYHSWFKVGSRHEKPGKTGLAHLFEHLMFNEVEGLPAGEFDTRMEAVGADNNASTWLDFTQYQEAFPKEHLPIVVDLESRRMSTLVLREEQLTSEKEVVKNERRYRVEDDVEGTVEELLWKTAFTTHPYHWPTIGFMDDIESFTTEDCEAFYEAYYAPNNASLILVGDLDFEASLKEISQAYGKLPPSTLPEEQTQPEPPQLEERVVDISQPTPTEKVVIGYKGPAVGEDDHILVSLVVEILTGGRASRLYRRLIRTEQTAADVSGFVGPHLHPSLIEFSLSAREGHTAEELLAVFDEEIERLLLHGIEKEELLRARNRTELGLLGSLETADGKASSIGFYQTLQRDPKGAFSRLDRLDRANQEQAVSAARRWLRRESRTVIRVRPQESERSEETA
jgi:zinc protease